MPQPEPRSAVRALPPAARALAAAVTDAVRAACARDAEGFTLAGARFTGVDPEQLRRLLSALLRPLLEDLHPDGVSGDDLRDAVAGCLARAGRWAPVVDPQVLVIVVAGAFGVHPEDEERPDVDAPEVARHACLLLADLLPRSGGQLGPYLEAAFVEIARSEREDDA